MEKISEMDEEESPTKRIPFFNTPSSSYQNQWDAMHEIVGCDYSFDDKQNVVTLGWKTRFSANDFYSVSSKREYASAFDARRNAIASWLAVWDAQYHKLYPLKIVPKKTYFQPDKFMSSRSFAVVVVWALSMVWVLVSFWRFEKVVENAVKGSPFSY